MRNTMTSSAAAALLGAALALPGGARADVMDCPPGGHVDSITGSATAGGRGLGCGDQLCLGDTISTGADGSVGVLMGGVLTQIGPNSRATMDTTLDWTPDVVVEQGTVRMVDPREGTPPAYLTAGGAKAEVVKNDVEAVVDGGAASICSYRGTVQVNGQAVAPGSCATAGTGALRVAASGGGAAALPALGGWCEPASPSIPALAHVVPTPPVASPPGNSPPLPDPPGGPPLNPCEIPGCGGGPPTVVVGQPPSTTPFPGQTGQTP